MKKRGHETTKLKGRNAPPVALHRGPTAADLQKQLDSHTRKLAETRSKLDQQSRLLSEALDQQKATSEVLRVISNSPIDLQSALGAIAESAARLLDVAGAEINRLEGDGLRLIAKHGAFSQRPIGSVRPITRGLVVGRAVIDRTTVHVPDLQAAEREFPEGADSARRVSASNRATPSPMLSKVTRNSAWRSRNSSNRRAFSIAITAWSAKVFSNVICFSVNGLTSMRRIKIAPTGFPCRNNGAASVVL